MGYPRHIRVSALGRSHAARRLNARFESRNSPLNANACFVTFVHTHARGRAIIHRACIVRAGPRVTGIHWKQKQSEEPWSPRRSRDDWVQQQFACNNNDKREENVIWYDQYFEYEYYFYACTFLWQKFSLHKSIFKRIFQSFFNWKIQNSVKKNKVFYYNLICFTRVAISVVDFKT